MDRPCRRGEARLIGAFRRDRHALLVTTALTAAVVSLLAFPARGQIAPNTQPTGGVVVAGSARIAASPTTTTVTQSSGRAAVNWQSFNIGSAATVDFVQPSAHAVTLNRVLAPDPSLIAGHVHANGGIVITNQAGVVFTRGSEVNATSVLVSAAGITNQNFMAGRMQFNIPAKPGARIVNAGRITLKSAGLAALVAPEVANSGVITARLGHVILAGGAAAETLDLYGDGLVSLDITPEAHTVRLANGAKATALVTNTGTIIASGGTVDLTARQADGLVQDLVDAGGTIAVNSIGRHSGTIAISGIGGSIRIPGTLLAEGKAPGTTGGAIVLDATGTVTLPASARLDASGTAGGGTVAIGTTLARARGGPGTAATLTANAVSIAPQARISASATNDGNGGRVTVFSLGTTSMAGTISARGGNSGGNGGSVEISGENLSLDGRVDTSAPLGATGSILLDPYNLEIVGSGGANDSDVTQTPFTGVALNAGTTTAGSTDTVDATAIEALSGNVTLQAINNLEIAANLSLGVNQSLTLQAGNDLTIDPKILVLAGGSIEMDAASSVAGSNTNPNGMLVVQGTVQAGGNLTLSAGTGGIIIGTVAGDPPGSIIGNAVVFDDPAGPVDDSGSSITATTVSGASTGASLTGSNSIGILANFDSSAGGTFNLEDKSALAVTGTVAVPTKGFLEIGADFLTLESGSSLVAPGGNVVLNAGAGSMVINGVIGNSSGLASQVSLQAGGPIFAAGGILNATTLSGSSAGASLTNISNNVSTLANFDSSTGGTFNLADKSPLTVTGQVTVPSGSFLAIEANTLSVNGGMLVAPGGTVQLAPFTNTNAVALIESGSVGAGTLAITGADLNGVSANVLQIGTPDHDGFVSGPIIIGNKGDVITIPNTPTLLLESGSGVTETGALDVSELRGIVGSATLDSPSNMIAALGGFSTSNGGFSLVETQHQPLLVSGAVSVPNGDTISLTADGVALGTSGSLIASGGTVSLASATPGLAFDLTTGLATASEGTLSLGDTAPDTAAISAGTLVIGAANGGQITITGAIDLPEVGVLDLLSGNALSEETIADALAVGTLEGSVASASLIGANDVGALGDFALSNGAFSLTNQQGLTIAGAVTAPGNSVTFTIENSGNLAEGTGGSITAATLTGGAGSAALTGANAVGTLGAFAASIGGFSLVEGTGQNLLVTGVVSVPIGQTLALTADGLAVGAAGSLSAPGATVTLASASSALPLDLTTGQAASRHATFSLGDTFPDTAAISAGTLIIGAGNGGAITITGSIGLPGTMALDLLSSGAVSEATTADSFSVGTLAASVAGASLVGNNGIGTLGSITATGGFTLTDTENLILAGPLDAAGNTAQLNDTGFALTEQNGGITAGTLSGGALSAALSGANEIGTLAAFTAPSGFSLTDGEALTIAGSLNAGTGPVNLTINRGSLLETGGGTITSGPLTGAASSVTLDNANSVGTLGAFTAGGNFSLTETGGQTLLVTGAVTVPAGQTIALTTDGLITVNDGVFNFGSLSAPGGTVKLTPASAERPIALLGFEAGSPGTLAIDDTDLAFLTAATLQIGSAGAGPILIGNAGDLITIPNALTSFVLESAGAITESGSLSAPSATLTGFAAAASLPAQGNNLGTLGSFTAAGGFTLTDAGNLLLAGSLDAGTATADLASVSGFIEEAAGLPAASITAGTLAASATGPIVLTEVNSIGTLGAITAPGGFTLDDPAGFFIAGNLEAAGATVLLTSDGAATEDGGSITAGILSGTLAAATLGGPNDITDLAALTAHGGLSLANDQALTVSGAVDIGHAAASFAITGGSLLEEGAGLLTAGLIEGSAAGVSLPNSANALATLGAFAAPDGLLLATANGLAVSGVVDTGTGAIDLLAGGSIAEIAGGTLIGGELLGFAGSRTRNGAAGMAAFANANRVASLGNFTALGGFTLADTGGLALLGALDVGIANVVLTGGAAVSEPSGTIIATTLSGTLASAQLGGANMIADLAGFTSTGGFSLTNLEPLTLTGPVSAGSAEGAFAVSGTLAENTAGVFTAGTLAANATLIDFAQAANAISSLGAISAPNGLTLVTTTGLAIAGSVNTAAAPVVLNAGGTIDEVASGMLTAGALTGSASAANFANTNNIGELGNFTARGGFTLDNAADLPVAGLLDAGAATARLVAGGSLYETKTTLLGETTVGSITAGTLTGSAGTVTLDDTANRIANLGSFSAGAFNLTDADSLTVVGTVTGDPIVLAISGNLVLGGGGDQGVLTGAGPVFLTVSGAITEPAGAIDAASLSGTAASASLGGVNLLPVLGDFTTTGSFLLNAVEPVLTVNGSLSAGWASLASAGSLVLAGLVSSASATLSAGGPISEQGGVISAGTLAGSAANATLTAANTIDTLGSFRTPGTSQLTDSAPLAVAGPVSAAFLGISDPAAVSFTGSTNVGTLSVTSGGSITEPGGAVIADLLQGSASGLAQFGPDAPAGSASITTLGPFSVASGTFTLTDSRALTITGPLDANYFAITAPGSIVLANTTITTLGLPAAAQSAADPTRPGSFFSVTTPGGKFLQLGRTTINPAGGTNTVRIQLNQAGGQITFADLVAPTTSLILDTGAGTAVGTIDLGALIVVGNLGSATLTGMVGNLSGIVASSKATISPFQSPRYRLNSCPLMSVNCIFIAPLGVPQGNPLEGLEIVSAPPARNDIDFLLPNVAAQDY